MRRLRFAAKVARRDPRLLLDYVRLWRGARHSPAPAGDWTPADDAILDWPDAARLVAPDQVPPEPGRTHARARAAIAQAGGDWASMDADASLGELAYALIRALQPDTVIETGVAQGISTAFVLAALADNDKGELHSIDLPPPRMIEDDLVGAAIPADLQSRWHYHWGSAARLLPELLDKTRGGRRLFIHDSDHSYAHMRWELETAWKSLQKGDVIIGDDANFHAGFADAAAAAGASASYVRQPETGGLTGLMLH